ncbi:hypothetical protein BYT27DRAFT_7180715 [Phlegmacium glaucopus]|nr:hypothetical protein BYT27DRAFT_7180715 [Phlegmacium glaucopus]
MDVILSIVAGLGLRIFLTTSGPSVKLTAALLGIWEGIIVHQLSARSPSPHLDHVLAYSLRLAADLLISKNLLRLFLVLLWTAFGTLVSEAVSPHASLRSALRRQREREKERERERRHRHSRSSSEALQILSTPLPLRMRTIGPSHSESHFLPSQAPQQSSTPFISSIPPPTPPSFFLHETSDIDSPSPKPVHLQTPQPVDSPIRPVRPRSGLAFILERSPDSGSPLKARDLLPTPPESAQSAAPSDGHDVQTSNADFHDTTKSLSPHRLSPIAELSSCEDTTPPETVHQRNKTEFDKNQQLTSFSPFGAISIIPPPEFNRVAYSSPPQVGTKRVLTSYSTNQNPDDIFTTPFSPTMSPAAPIPVPIPQRKRQDLFWQIHTTPRNLGDINIDIPQIVDVCRDHNGNDNNIDDKSPDSDELRTPGLRDTLNAETDNENDDPLLTPVRMISGEGLEAERAQLSPLVLNVHSGLGSDDYIRLSDVEGNSSDRPPDTPNNDEVLEELHMPGSLSQNLLLQPPLPPSGSFFPRRSSPTESPAPPSPSTIFSDTTMLSQLSTRVPSKLFLRADEFRKQARQEEQSREQLDMERKIAEAQGKTAEALILKIRVRELDDKAYKLHEKAARRYYAACNPLDKGHKIDLHGLRPREAFIRAERALAKAIKEGRKQLYLIVGQGKHSINGKPVLKKTVQTEIMKNGFKCEVDARNPGVLVVTLPPPQPPS